MKKVAILLLHMQHGGIEKQTITFANELSKNYDVEIICTYSMNKEPAYQVDDKIKITYLMDVHPNKKEIKEAFSKFKIFHGLKELVKGISIVIKKKTTLIRALKNINTDYILATRMEQAKLVAKYAPKSVVKMTQEHQHNDTSKYIKKVKKYFSKLDVLVVLSERSKEFYTKWLEGSKIQIVAIPNILESIDERKCKLHSKIIVSVGRLHKVKNFSALIDVASIVVLKDPEVKFVIVGGGEEENSLREKIEKYNLQQNVIITGMVSADEVKDKMLNSSIYAMTSLTECFPMVLLEASACGLPMIAFDVLVGPRAIITEGKDGYLINPFDVNEMADKILYLLNNNEIINEFSKYSKEKAMRYLPSKVMPLWYEILK